MHFPVQVRLWPKTQLDAELSARLARARQLFSKRIAFVLQRTRTRAAVPLSRTRAPINLDWILGSLGWTALVYAIVHFGGAMS